MMSAFNLTKDYLFSRNFKADAYPDFEIHFADTGLFIEIINSTDSTIIERALYFSEIHLREDTIHIAYLSEYLSPKVILLYE